MTFSLPGQTLFPWAFVLLAGIFPLSGGESALWGVAGETWDPAGRLPDFSHAGYQEGKTPPSVPPGISVMDFGAKGDGVTDDSDAFLKALEKATGAIEVPAGRYVITKILFINRPGIVLRGTSPDQSILVLPTPLSAIKPHWGATTAGKRTSEYSWSGGMVWIQGSFSKVKLASVTAPAARGDSTIQVDDAAGLEAGKRVTIYQKDTPENTLAGALYSGDPGDTAELRGSTFSRTTCRVVSVTGATVLLDRPLRVDLKLEWKPEIRSATPTVTGSGVENLGFEFPEKDYEGHFSELGHNAVGITGAADCWVRNIRTLNADSGVFVEGNSCTIENVIFEARRKPDKEGNAGHHGVYFGGDDNIFSGFDYRVKFIHDISVSHCSGNVFMDGRGLDLCFDHHKRAPYENLFTNLDAGTGTRLWASGGGEALGRHCGGRTTFWNIQASRPLTYPPAGYAPASINVVGIPSKSPGETSPGGKWFEQPGSTVTPPNLYRSQVEKFRKVPPVPGL